MKQVVIIYVLISLFILMGFYVPYSFFNKRYSSNNIKILQTIKSSNEQLSIDAANKLEVIQRTQHEKHRYRPLYETAWYIHQQAEYLQQFIKNAQEHQLIADQLLVYKKDVLKKIYKLSKLEIPGLLIPAVSVDRLASRLVLDRTELNKLKTNTFFQQELTCQNVLLILEHQFLDFISSQFGDKMLCYDHFDVYTNHQTPAFQGQAHFVELIIGGYTCYRNYNYNYERYYVNGRKIDYDGDECVFEYVPRKRGLDSLHLRAERFDYQDALMHSEEKWIKFFVDP